MSNRPDRSLVPEHVIVVLGYRECGADDAHGISAICRAGVRRAQALAVASPPRAVILTGWSSNGGPSEADQMAAAWEGDPDVLLVCERHATNTAENAVRSLEILRSLGGGCEVTVVCGRHHALRVRYFFGRLYRRHGHVVRYDLVQAPRPPARLWWHELSSMTRMLRDRRRALRLLGEPHRRRARAG